MALNISAWSIRKPIPPLVLFAVLIVIGLVSFRSLPVTQMPNIDVPVVTVTIAQAGAAPSELETQVARPVEDAIAGLTGVKHVTSALSDGVAVAMVEFVLETPTDRAVNDVRDAVAKIRTTLPQSIEEPVIQRIDVAGLPILTYAASIPGMSVDQLSWFVDDTVVRALQGVPGIAQVKRIGGVDREIRVDLRPDRLAALGITASEVNDQLRASNIDLAGGRGTIGVQEQSIRTLAGAATVEELAQRRIALPGGRQALLQDLATVTDGGAEPRSFARVDGKPVVAFSLYRSKGFSDVVVGDAAAARLQQLTAEHPELSISEIDNLVRYTRADYDMTMETLIEGAILAVIVVFLFLRDFRATIISAARHPAVGAADLRGDGRAGLLAELDQPAGDHAGDRHPGRRRHRRDREHRPPHAHGQVGLPRRDPGGGRDRPGRGRHHHDHRRGVPAGQLHGRHRRPVLQAVRHHRRRRRHLLAAGGAAGDAADGGLSDARQGP